MNQEPLPENEATPEIVVNFLKNEHELAKLAKSLDKASKRAVEYLEGVMNDKDASIDQRAKAAEKILQFALAASKQINDDNMARLIAQVRLAPGGKPPVPLKDGDKPPTPRLDFDTVRDVNKP